MNKLDLLYDSHVIPWNHWLSLQSLNFILLDHLQRINVHLFANLNG